jgi:hypothetical protein
MRRQCAKWALGWLLCLWGAAHAHLMSPNQASLNVREDAAFMVLALPVKAFAGVASQPEGLDAQDLQRESARLEQQLRQHLSLTGDKALAFEVALISLTHADHGPRSDQLLFYLRFAWPAGPHPRPALDQLRLRFDLFVPGTSDSLKVEVIHQDKRYALLLTPDWPHSVLRPSGWAVVQRHVQQGLMHLALGADHVLFLALLLLKQVQLRRWAWLLSGLTAAHATSYALVLLAPPQGQALLTGAWVEPAIAATLAASALGLLWRGSLPVAAEALMVLGLGAVHGLGFASAMAGLELLGPQAWLGWMGHGAGIGLGQLLLALALWPVLRRISPGRLPHWQRAGGGAGLALSLGLLHSAWA